jgi:ribulose 1,5-bisphosphate carboxylase large subunit-like protein
MRDKSYLICVDESSIDRESHIIATYDVQVEEAATLDKVAETIAYDPTIGTWSTVGGETETVIENYSGKVLLPLPSENERRGRIRIAIPAHNIDPIAGGIPELMALLGAPYTLKQISRIHLVNIDFPPSFVASLPGPGFGIDGVRQAAGVAKVRPLIATMLKPRSGLTTAEYAIQALEALRGGVDVIFDDELLISPESSPLLERVAAVSKAAHRAETETGLPKRYAANITSSIRHARDIALKVQDLGADFLYLNPVAMGLSALEMLAADEEIHLPILCCRSSYGMLARGKNGLAYFVFLKMARLCGADGIHMGSIGGKLPHAIIGDDSELRSRVSWLRARIPGINRTMPIISGGMHPGSVEWNAGRLGGEIILQAGSGVIGHPDGPCAGGKAMRAAVQALLDGIPTHEAARSVPELETALRKWGYLDGQGIHTLDELWHGEHLHSNVVIHTEGGAVVWGDVKAGGDFVGRDQKKEDE